MWGGVDELGRFGGRADMTLGMEFEKQDNGIVVLVEYANVLYR